MPTRLETPIQYIAGQIFEIPSLNVVYGAPGSLKSFFLADLAVCVAGGKFWLPPLIEGELHEFPVKQRPVVWLDFDNGKRRTHDRFSALGKSLELPPETPLYYYSMPDPIFNAGNDNHIFELSKIIIEHEAKLVIIDNLGIISGGQDENSSSMIPLLSHLRGLVDTTQAVVIIIHHRRKGSNRNTRLGDDLRGHSSIESALDLVLLIDRKKDSDTISIQATKERGADVPKFSAAFTCEIDSDKQLQTARFYSVKSDKDFETELIRKTVYEFVINEPINKTKLIEKVHSKLKVQNGTKSIGIHRIGECIDEMVKLEFLIRAPGLYNAQLITRNPEKAI